MAIRSADVDVLSILHQHCRQPDLLLKWTSVEAKNVLPTNSRVKENQLFGFAVVPQSDIDMGTSLDMPEYAFHNHLANAEKIFKFADDCLSDALQKKKDPTYNLLLYKLDEAVNAANDMLIVKQKNILPCGMFLYKYCPAESCKEVQPNVCNTYEMCDGGEKHENVQKLADGTESVISSPGIMLEKLDDSAQITTERVKLVDISPSMIRSHPEFGCVINIEPQNPSERFKVSPEASSVNNESGQPKVILAESENNALGEKSLKRKKDRDVDSSLDRTKKYKKKRPRAKVTDGMNSLGPSYSVKDMLEMGTGYPGWKRFGVTSILDDDLRTNTKSLSERFSKNNDSESVTESDQQMQSYVEREALDNDLMDEKVENRKEVSQIQVHISVDKMRYEKMGQPPPPPMPQSLIDRSSKSSREDLGNKVKSLFEKALAPGKGDLPEDVLSTFHRKLKGQTEGIQYLRKTLKNEMAQSEGGERKLLEIKKTLKMWKEKSVAGKIDEPTKQKILAVTQYVQQILRKKLSRPQDKEQGTNKDPGSNAITGTHSTEQSGDVENEKIKDSTEKDVVSSSNIAQCFDEGQCETMNNGVQGREVKKKTYQIIQDIPEEATERQNERGVKANRKASSKHTLRRTEQLSETVEKCVEACERNNSGRKSTKQIAKQDTGIESNDCIKHSDRGKLKDKHMVDVHKVGADKDILSKAKENEEPRVLSGKDVFATAGASDPSGDEGTFDADALLEELYDNRVHMSHSDKPMERQENMDQAEGGEADMSLDESFDTETSNIHLDSTVVGYESGAGAGFGMQTMEYFPVYSSTEAPPLPDGPPPELPSAPVYPGTVSLHQSQGLVMATEAQGKLLQNVLKKTQSKEFQDRLKSAIGVLGTESEGNGSVIPRANEAQEQVLVYVDSGSSLRESTKLPKSLHQRRLSQGAAHQQNKSGSIVKHRHTQDTKSESLSGQASRRAQDDKIQRRGSSDSRSKEKNTSSKETAKTTKADTFGKFHGRTLLMGKTVPPRQIPLEPLYLTKLYTSSGNKQVRPTDPRPKYYTNGGLEKRIIKQMEEEAKKMIRNSFKKREMGSENKEGVGSGFNVHTVDVEMINPCQTTGDSEDSQKEVLCSSRTINTLGAELEKRINTQVQVAYKKLTSEAGNKVNDSYSTTPAAVRLEDRRLAMVEPDATSTQSESVDYSDPWEARSPEVKLDLFHSTDREQLRQEAEWQLQEVERRLDELRGRNDNHSDKEDGEVSDDFEVELRKGRHKRIKSKRIHAEFYDENTEKGTEKRSEDAVDPWEAPFQESNTLDSIVYDPWSSPKEDSGRYVEERNSRVLFRTYSNDENEFYSRSQRSGSPSFSRRRSRSPLHSWRSHRRSRSPNYRQHNRSRSPDGRRHVKSRSREGRRYVRSRSPDCRTRVRSRSPDYKRSGMSRSSDCQERVHRHVGDSRRHKIRPYPERQHGGRPRRSPSGSPLHDPWRKKEDRIAANITTESDEEVIFLGIRKANGKENVPKPGERVVEKVVHGLKSSRGQTNAKTSDAIVGNGSRVVSKIRVTGDKIVASNRNVEVKTLPRHVVSYPRSSSPLIKTENVNHHAFQKYESFTKQYMKCSSPATSDQHKEDTRSCDIRQVVSSSDGPVVTVTDTSNTANTPGSLKKFTNKDVWKLPVNRERDCKSPRPSVFSRLGSKGSPKFNVQKLPPKQRLEEIRNEAVYTDDTFGDLNTSMTMLEGF